MYLIRAREVRLWITSAHCLFFSAPGNKEFATLTTPDFDLSGKQVLSLQGPLYRSYTHKTRLNALQIASTGARELPRTTETLLGDSLEGRRRPYPRTAGIQS